MAKGQVLSIPDNASQLVTTLSREEKKSLALLNPNDGICYLKLNGPAGLRIAEWDWKLPSQSYGLFPGPWQSLGLLYIDQSGSGRAAELNLYDNDSSLVVPQIHSIGRAVQVAGTAMDITQGNQPQNPPLGTSRLWVDANNNLYILDDDGTNVHAIDTNDVLGGALSGTLPNPTLAANSVGSAQIIDGAIAAIDLGNGVVTNPKIAADAVQTANILNANVTAAKLAAGAASSNIGSLGGALTGTLPQTIMTYFEAQLPSNVALTQTTYHLILSCPALSPQGSVWLIFWKVIATANTAGAYISAGLFNAGGSVIDTAGGTVPLNYAGSSGEVTLSGHCIYTTSVASDQPTIRVYATHAGSVALARDVNYASGNGTSLRVLRMF